jgi:hypothetical protein
MSHCLELPRQDWYNRPQHTEPEKYQRHKDKPPKQIETHWHTQHALGYKAPKNSKTIVKVCQYPPKWGSGRGFSLAVHKETVSPRRLHVARKLTTSWVRWRFNICGQRVLWEIEGLPGFYQYIANDAPVVMGIWRGRKWKRPRKGTCVRAIYFGGAHWMGASFKKVV